MATTPGDPVAAADRARALLVEGFARQQAGQLADAQTAYQAVLALEPAQFDALHLLGVIAAQMGQFHEAVRLIGRAIEIEPRNAAAHYNLGYALEDLRQYQAAILSYDRAIALKPDHAVAYNNRGIALAALKQNAAAVASFEKAISLRPDYAEAHNNCGVALGELAQHEAAIQSFDRVLALDPQFAFLQGTRLYAKLRICDWADIEGDIARMLVQIERGDKVSPPWPVLAITGALPLQRKAAEIWAAEKYPDGAVGKIPARARREKIRVGYFSMDYRDHPLSTLMAGLFEAHSRERFEIYGFSFGPDTGDAMRRRIIKGFDTFIEVGDKPDREIADMAKALGIDIAVDLAGYTTDSRAGIFALGAAPIQVAYLGYPGTMGARHIDYLFADKLLIPPESRRHYAEKIVYLPGFQVNDESRAIADKLFTRAELGLPPSGFVFCCFNNSFKILPAVFDSWMRILQRVEGSVLFLFAEGELTRANLRTEAVRRGVDAARVVFGGRLPMPEYLARFRAADLFLDTLPYNAGTTASDAIWAGLPVLTRAGESFAGRMAASVLDTMGLSDMITTTQVDYEALAVALATNPGRLADVRHRLERNRPTARLFNVKAFAGTIETAYCRMLERLDAGLAPEHLEIDT